MSREILFKAKRKDNGEWVEGYVVAYPSGKVEIHKISKELPDILLKMRDCSKYFMPVHRTYRQKR